MSTGDVILTLDNLTVALKLDNVDLAGVMRRRLPEIAGALVSRRDRIRDLEQATAALLTAARACLQEAGDHVSPDRWQALNQALDAAEEMARDQSIVSIADARRTRRPA